MKFVYEEHYDYTSFTAIPENDKETSGFRAQGPYVPIQMKDNKLIVKYVSHNKLHPDIIAAICITAFYPFIHSTATMPFPVSKQFASGLLMDILPQHGKIDGVYRATEPIIITNIDDELEPYSQGENTVIAYGGGMDSTALACLFPEYDLIHSTDLDTMKNNVQLFVYDNLENNIHIIESNCKNISSPGGFTTFTNKYITPLIMSADLNIKNIMCGEILGSTCLSNGTKYFPQFDVIRRNRWERFYNHIGIHMFSPLAGCSELITSKIICEYGLYDKVIYCENNNGLPCNKCTKCLRKQLELTYHGKQYSFEHYETHFITNFLKKRPLYFGHIFIETIKRIFNKYKEEDHEQEVETETVEEDEPEVETETVEEDEPEVESTKQEPEEVETDIESKLYYLKCAIDDIIDIDTSFCNKIYTKSFCYFPEDIKEHIIEQLLKYAECMSADDEIYLEKWDMTISKQLIELSEQPKIISIPDDIQTIINENYQLKLENENLHKKINTILKIIDQINVTRLETAL